MSKNVLDEVQAGYASVARSSLSSKQAGVRAVAEAFGYTPAELAAIPAKANTGLRRAVKTLAKSGPVVVPG